MIAALCRHCLGQCRQEAFHHRKMLARVVRGPDRGYKAANVSNRASAGAENVQSCYLAQEHIRVQPSSVILLHALVSGAAHAVRILVHAVQ